MDDDSLIVIDCYTDGTHTILEYLEYGTRNFIVSRTTNRHVKFNGKEYFVNLLPVIVGQ